MDPKTKFGIIYIMLGFVHFDHLTEFLKCENADECPLLIDPTNHGYKKLEDKTRHALKILPVPLLLRLLIIIISPFVIRCLHFKKKKMITPNENASHDETYCVFSYQLLLSLQIPKQTY